MIKERSTEEWLLSSSAIEETSIEKTFQSNSSWKNDRLKNGFDSFHWSKIVFPLFKEKTYWRMIYIRFSDQRSIKRSNFPYNFNKQRKINCWLISPSFIDQRATNLRINPYHFTSQKLIFWGKFSMHLIEQRAIGWRNLFLSLIKERSIPKSFLSTLAMIERSIEKWFQSNSSWKNDRLKNGYYLFHRSQNDFPLFIHQSKNNTLKSDFYPFPRPKIDRLKIYFYPFHQSKIDWLKNDSHLFHRSKNDRLKTDFP